MSPRFLGIASHALSRMHRFLWKRPIPESSSAYSFEGKTYHFVEEPLGLPASSGYGYPEMQFFQKIGPRDRYEISRKLDWNASGSLWLARDTIDQSFVAVKILTQADTGRNGTNDHDKSYEVEALRKTSATESLNCVQLQDMFVYKGAHNLTHNALVLSALPGGRLLAMGDVRRNMAGSWIFRDDDDLREAIRHMYPGVMHLRKRILRDVLKGLVHLHSHGVVHTNLHYWHIGAESSMTKTDIERELELKPPRRHPWEASYYPKRVSSAVTQHLPYESDDPGNTAYYIMDLSEARLLPEGGTQNYGGVHPIASICPPELLLQGSWNEKIDIWQFGCLVYQVLSLEQLFYYLPIPEIGYPAGRSLLWQMTCTTGERFPDSLRSKCRAWDKFFETSGALTTNPPLSDMQRLELLLHNGSIDEADIIPTSEFMRRCLRLDPDNRPSALELLNDPWFNGIDE